MSYPILKPNSSWFTPTVSTIKRATITTINIVDSYTPSTTPTDSWDASVAQDGGIMCYVEGTALTIAGNGSGKIMANADSNAVFSDAGAKDYFTKLSAINGANILDTSNATIMTRMFNQCNALTYVDVSNWDTSKVTSMRIMFQQCNKLATLDVSNWDTSNVTDIGVLFSKCYLLNNIDVSNWNLSKVTDMKNMFRQCSALTSLNTTNWNVSSCKTMYGLFDSCTALVDLDVSNWDVSSVEDFTYAFYDCPIATLDVSNWDVSSGKIFNGMFENCESLGYVDVSKWNMSNATDISFMFYKMTPMTSINVSNWDVSNVENFDHMFAHCTNLADLDVSKWNVTNKCTNLSALFHSTDITSVDVSGWDTSNVIAMSQCFEATKLEKIIGLETWNTSNCICFSQMFSGSSNLKELDLSNFDTRKAKRDGKTQVSSNGSKCSCTTNMLNGLTKLEKITLGVNFTFEGDGTSDSAYFGSLPTPSNTYITNADGNWYAETGETYAVADVPNLSANTYYAYPVSVLMKGSDFCATIPSSAKSVIFTEVAPPETATLTNVGAGGNSSVVAWLDGTTYYVYCQGSGKYLANADCSYMFSNKKTLTSIDTGNLNTINTTNMKYMFGGTSSSNLMSLTSITFGEYFDTSNVTDFSYMFNYCISVPQLDVSGFNTSKATTMSRMFNQMRIVEALDLSSFDTGNVTDMKNMFQRCELMTDLTLGENFKTGKVIDMSYMFSKCYGLTTIDVSDWDTSSLITGSTMFNFCTGLKELDVSKWNVSKLQDASYMFNECTALTALDVSNWNTSACTNMSFMLCHCYNLQSIDVSKWDVSNVTSIESFITQSIITSLDVSNWNTSSMTNVSFAFYNCDGLTELALDNWDVSNVTNFDHFLAHCSNLANYDVSKWNVTSACKNLYATFHSTKVSSIDVTGWDTSNVIAFGQCFEAMSNLTEIKGLNTWDTSSGIDFPQMFSGCSKLKELDLSSFDTRKAKNDKTSVSTNGSTATCTQHMFRGMSSLEKITLGANFTFAGDGTAATAYRGTLPTPTIGYWYTEDGARYAPSDVPNLTAATYYARVISILKPNSTWFAPTVSTTKRNVITTINFTDSYTPSGTVTDSWDASVAQDGSIMCYLEGTVLTIAGNGSGKIIANADSSWVFCDINKKDLYNSLTAINGLNMLDTSNATTMAYMFAKLPNVAELDVSGFNTDKVESLEMMFSGDSLISELDIAHWNISACKSLNGTFDRVVSMTSIDIANWDTSNVEDMKYLFNGDTALTTVDVSKWNTSKLTTFFAMCQNCKALTSLDVSRWNTSNVTNMAFAFYSCDALTELAVDNWDVRNVTTLDHTFAHCDNLKVNVSKWIVTNKCQYLDCIFHSNANTYLDVSGFDTSGAISMFSMFEANRNLEKIDGLQNFDTSNCHAFEEMFSGCYALKELDLSSFDTRKADADTLARSDGNGYKSQCTKSMFAGCSGLEKITLGENFTFAGDGTAASTYYGTLPTPTIGYWYTEDGAEYAPTDVPNLTYAVYYASPDIMAGSIWDRDSKKYMHLAAMRIYHNMHNAEIDAKFNYATDEDVLALFN